MPQCPFTLLSRLKAKIVLLPYLGAALGCAGLLGVNTRDSISMQLTTSWSIPAITATAVICAVFFAVALKTRTGLRTSVVLPRWAQKSIYFGGLTLMTTLMVASAITFGVWNDTNNQKIPNRFMSNVSIATQRFLFGDCAALDWIWVLSQNATNCGDSKEAKFWKDEAEAFCINTPSFNYKRFEYANGDIVHKFDNTPLGSLKESNFVHEDDSTITFGDKYVEFPSGFGQAKRIDLGEEIRTIEVIEKTYGGKEYKFNGAKDPQITYNPYDHCIIAYLKNGQLFFERDMTTNCMFAGDVALAVHEQADSQNCQLTGIFTTLTSVDALKKQFHNFDDSCESSQSSLKLSLSTKPARVRVYGAPTQARSIVLWDSSGNWIGEGGFFPDKTN